MKQNRQVNKERKLLVRIFYGICDAISRAYDRGSKKPPQGTIHTTSTPAQKGVAPKPTGKNF